MKQALPKSMEWKSGKDKLPSRTVVIHGPDLAEQR
jgi:hypothetical protein